MEGKRGLTILVVLGLVIIMYFLGSRITGFTSQTMYCDGESCKEICTYTGTCQTLNEICCEMDGFAVCEKEDVCENEYVYFPSENPFEEDVEVRGLENPSGRIDSILLCFVIFVLLVIIVALCVKKKKPKKKKRKKR